MLDFYIIKDDTPRPNQLKDLTLKFAGALDYETFEQLKAKNIIEERYDYYKDLRFSSIQVKQKHDLLLKSNQNLKSSLRKTITPESIMLDILNIAIIGVIDKIVGFLKTICSNGQNSWFLFFHFCHTYFTLYYFCLFN